MFRVYPGSTRQDRIVLAQWAGPKGPGQAGVAQSSNTTEQESVELRGMTIELQPLNTAYDPIVPQPEYEDEISVIAKFVDVAKAPDAEK